MNEPRALVRSLAGCGALAWLTACATPLELEPQPSGTDQSLRGVCAVNADVVWASGATGTVLRTTDGGATWQHRAIPGAEQLDFRDVHALDAQRAWVMVAGAPARIYATADGGATWQVQAEHPSPSAFYDSIAFWEPQNGLLFGDPVEGALTVWTTTDGGASWQPARAPELPAPLAGEAGFAASGTCACVWGDTHAWIGTGGGARARVLRSEDRGRSWQAADTPLAAGTSSAGIFSLAFRDAQHGVAVGGDYQQPARATGNAAVSADGGVTWNAAQVSPRGYRSAVAFVPGSARPLCVAVGPTGVDFSVDGGAQWLPFSDAGYHAVAVAPDGAALWCVGAGGRIARLAEPARLGAP